MRTSFICLAAFVSFPFHPFAEEPMMRLTEPRIAPLERSEWTEVEEALLGEESKTPYNINVFNTLVRSPELYESYQDFLLYLLRNSTLPERDREILILRIGWLRQSQYEWGRHVLIARRVGLTDEEIHRIAEGADAEGWPKWERALLRAVDEIWRDRIISDPTWALLAAQYSTQQLMDAVWTIGQYESFFSMAINSLGVQLEETVDVRLPGDVPKPGRVAKSTSARLTEQRIPALSDGEWTEEQRELIQGRENMNLYRTFVNHTAIYTGRKRFADFILRGASVPARERELLIMRIAWLNNCSYEWTHHIPGSRRAGLDDDDIRRIVQGPNAEGWSDEDATILRAVDEMYTDGIVLDATWNALSERFDAEQLIDILFTVGKYNMTAIAINSLGIQDETGPGWRIQ